MRKGIKTVSTLLLAGVGVIASLGLTSCSVNDDYIAEKVNTYIEEHKDELKGEKGDTGATGAQGEKGEDGVDGTNGTNGTNGATGNGIVSIKCTNTNLTAGTSTYTITYTNGTTYTFTIANGKDGTNGKDGETPTFSINANNHIIATYSNGSSKDCGEVVVKNTEYEYKTEIVCCVNYSSYSKYCNDPAVTYYYNYYSSSSSYTSSNTITATTLKNKIASAYSVECEQINDSYCHHHYIITTRTEKKN